jgi:hypothetical protein
MMALGVAARLATAASGPVRRRLGGAVWILTCQRPGPATTTGTTGSQLLRTAAGSGAVLDHDTTPIRRSMGAALRDFATARRAEPNW